MMQQVGLLPFEFQPDHPESKLTSFSGLPLYLDMVLASGLDKKIQETLSTKYQGWNDVQIIISLICLNLVGGTSVEDIDRMENDQGFRELLLKIETYGMTRKARREHQRRWRKQKQRALPSSSVLRRYLEKFHHAEEESLREKGKAFIPANNVLLNQLVSLNQVLINFAQEKNPSKVATLDQDATLCETYKESALYCYKKFKAHQPFNTYWHEQGLIIHSEFRDGNVPAGYEQKRLLEESLDRLPSGVNEVYLRSDSAGYQQAVLTYCAEGHNERFGVIEFAIAARVTSAFKTAALEVPEEDWHPVITQDKDGHTFQTQQEWAEVCFVPNFVAASKDDHAVYRYIAIRERMREQMTLDEIAPVQQDLPFPTVDMHQQPYKLFAIVTNRTLEGNELINWHRKRCGDSEHIHSIEKKELAGGKMPSKYFGANAAWWHCMVFALNLHGLMQLLALPASLKNKRFKAVRFLLIGVAGRYIRHARRLILKLSGGQQVWGLFSSIREKIAALLHGPPASQAA